MKVPLTWNVYVGDFNRRSIEIYNVFEHSSFVEDFGKTAKKLERDKTLTDEQRRERFAEELRRDLMYYFWSKCEWEIVLSSWPPRDGEDGLKIDVYGQIRLNWEVFVDYVWENRRKLWTEI